MTSETRSPLVPRGESIEVLAHVRLLRVGDGQDRQVAVYHAQHHAVPVCRALQGTQIGRNSETKMNLCLTDTFDTFLNLKISL